MKKFIIIENHTKWMLQNIPSECLRHERWPVWGYIGMESAMSSLLFSYVSNFRYVAILDLLLYTYIQNSISTGSCCTDK